jgi:hypothetical protein
MSGLIEEIQRDAFDQSVPVSVLLRKVKAAASKLSLPPTERWVHQELEGYLQGDLPPYRELRGSPKALNPYQGWIPILFQEKEINHMLSTCPVRQSIASLEALVAGNETNHVQFPIPPDMVIHINSLMDVRFGTMAVHIPTSGIHGLLDAVRNLVLEWALTLERAGIHGAGMSFNREEKQLAKDSSTTINIGSIGSMVGNLGSNNRSGNISASDISIEQLREISDQLKPHVTAIKAAGADAQLLDKSLADITAQCKSGNPGQSKMRGALTDLRNALSGATGSLIASGAITFITKLLGG